MAAGSLTNIAICVLKEDVLDTIQCDGRRKRRVVGNFTFEWRGRCCTANRAIGAIALAIALTAADTNADANSYSRCSDSKQDRY